MQEKRERKEILYKVPKLMQRYLDRKNTTLNRLCTENRLDPRSLYPILRGKRIPQRWLAIKICAAMEGELTLFDFGHDPLSVDD